MLKNSINKNFSTLLELKLEDESFNRYTYRKKVSVISTPDQDRTTYIDTFGGQKLGKPSGIFELN